MAGFTNAGRVRAAVACAAILALALACAAGAGRHGSLRWNLEAGRAFEAAQLLAGHRYYTTGSEVEPRAVVAMREGRPLRGAWREIEATPELLAKIRREMQGTRLAPPDAALILDDRGEAIGAWYSYLPMPPPPKLLDDGGVELDTPFPPADGPSDRSGARFR